MNRYEAGRRLVSSLTFTEWRMTTLNGVNSERRTRIVVEKQILWNQIFPTVCPVVPLIFATLPSASFHTL
jgi:hypothetical protein